MTIELAPCPWCQKVPLLADAYVDPPRAICVTEACPMLGIALTVDRWNTRAPSPQDQRDDFGKLMSAIAAIDPDEDWRDASPGDLNEEYAPWEALNRIGAALSPQATRDSDSVVEALADLLDLAEDYECRIDDEWGSGRSLKQIEKDGHLPKAIVNARAAIARAEKGGRK
jgi:hypothetical protein